MLNTLSLKIDLNFFYQKPVGMWKFFSQKTAKKIFYQKLEKKNIGQLPA